MAFHDVMPDVPIKREPNAVSDDDEDDVEVLTRRRPRAASFFPDATANANGCSTGSQSTPVPGPTGKKLDEQDIRRILANMSSSALAQVNGLRDSAARGAEADDVAQEEDVSAASKNVSSSKVGASLPEPISASVSLKKADGANGTIKSTGVIESNGTAGTKRPHESTVESSDAADGTREASSASVVLPVHVLGDRSDATLIEDITRTQRGRTATPTVITNGNGLLRPNGTGSRASHPPDGVATLRTSPSTQSPATPHPDALSETAYQHHMAILRRVEREYHEDKAELTEIEQRHTELATGAARAAVETEKLRVALAAKEAQATRTAAMLHELTGMQKLLKRRLVMRKETWQAGRAKGDDMRRRLEGRPSAEPTPKSASVAPTHALPPRVQQLPLQRQESMPASYVGHPSHSMNGEPQTVRSRTVSGEPCLAYNLTGCDNANCPLVHACVACGLAHTYILCTTKRTSCFRFNNEEACAAPPCRREHRCLRCASTSHRWLECDVPPADDCGVEYCLTWNSSRNCHSAPRCDRRHQCLRCSGPHAVIACPDNAAAYLKPQIPDGLARTVSIGGGGGAGGRGNSLFRGPSSGNFGHMDRQPQPPAMIPFPNGGIGSMGQAQQMMMMMQRQQQDQQQHQHPSLNGAGSEPIVKRMRIE
ncbi:hypothetical protein HKX48_004758 [Thoreauomyces humboldtii]|nr:hypothetical protein HKX48_004758 [Thoreauomyces humboldtii]